MSPTSLSLTSIIPMNVHAAVEYLGGATLLAAPRLFGWSGTSARVSVAAGAATLGMSLLTAYEPAEPETLSQRGTRAYGVGTRNIQSAPETPLDPAQQVTG